MEPSRLISVDLRDAEAAARRRVAPTTPPSWRVLATRLGGEHRRLIERLLLIGVLVGTGASLCRLSASRALWSNDETDLVSLAFAMTEDAALWLRPTYHPLDDPRGVLGQGIVAPPLASALMALPMMLGIDATWAWSVVGGAVFVGGMIALTRALSGAPLLHVAAAVALMVALSPRLAVDVLFLEAEVPLAGFCAFAMAASLSKTSRLSVALRAALSGGLLGLGFLCKLWLVLPAALSCFLVFAVGREQRARALFALVVAALFVGSAHFVFVLACDPESVGRWLSEVYFSAFQTTGVAATKWEGVDAYPNWSHGVFYYPAAIARELGFGAPLAVAGSWILARSAARRPSASSNRRVAAAVGLSLGLAALSVPAIKEPLYVLTIISSLASVGALYLVLALRARPPLWSVGLVLVVALVASVTAERPPGVIHEKRALRILAGQR